MKIFIDGKFCRERDAKVSVFDHGLLYGDGVFEGIRAYNGRVFKLKEHIDRLFYSAKAILLDLPMSHAEMMKATVETIRANKLRDCYVRLIVTRGIGTLGLNPRSCKKPSVNPAIKSLNYLNNILAKIEANNAGVEEAVMLNAEGFVSECTADNLFIIKHGVLLTPPNYAGALYGITRGTVMELAEPLGIKVSETNLTRYDLFNADECFLTGTGAEIMPVIKIDGRVIGSGKPGLLALKLIEAYHALTKVSGEPIYK
jgi:branched-chain amino acid aminotransferase